MRSLPFFLSAPNSSSIYANSWLATISAAAHAGRSLIFTFAPEPMVSSDFPARLHKAVEDAGGKVLSVALDIEDTDQEQRLITADRAMFGKLRSLELLRELRPGITACLHAMPPANLERILINLDHIRRS